MAKDIVSSYKFTGSGLNDIEKKWGKKRFNDYRKNYNLSSIGVLSLLEDLVFIETIQERYKKKAELLAKDAKEGEDVLPRSLRENIEACLDQQIKLKEKLGFFDNKDDTKDPFRYIQQLEKKFKIHREQNRADYSIPCEHCGEMNLLKIRTKNYTSVKHPFFRGKILTNKPLWEAYKKGEKVTKNLIAKVLNSSLDYIDWLEANLYPNVRK